MKTFFHSVQGPHKRKDSEELKRVQQKAEQIAQGLESAPLSKISMHSTVCSRENQCTPLYSIDLRVQMTLMREKTIKSRHK